MSNRYAAERQVFFTVRKLGEVRGKQIVCPDGFLGNVHDVLLDPYTDQPTHLVVRDNSVLVREVNIPVSCITTVDDQSISVRINRAELDVMPHCWW